MKQTYNQGGLAFQIKGCKVEGPLYMYCAPQLVWGFHIPNKLYAGYVPIPV